ncbi:unnamed protein product [Candidatus Protochlamydia amoebophila UWE25]|uniref:Uncharacterized protein n=1 Tax=Protochlamydia amoebophila (strain UWE25) TaxID=264201 RepID=Q6MAR5_PARUW|nr:unnamed protein product [Candidatus Protochlamydia amoebophila UWE25]
MDLDCQRLLKIKTAVHWQFNQYYVVRMEKLVEKLWKLEKSQDKDKIYSPIVDIKSEIESSCGVNIDLR